MDQPLRGFNAARLPRASCIAVLAVSAASVLISHKGIDAWRDRWVHKAEPRTVSVGGNGTLSHVPPDSIVWTMSIAVIGPTEEAAEASARDKRIAVLDELRARGNNFEIHTAGLDVVPASDDMSAIGWGGRPSSKYRATQDLQIRSLDVPVALEAYRSLSAIGASWLTVDTPYCRLEDPAPAKRRAEEAAWIDLHRRVIDARANLHLAIGPALSFSLSEPDVVEGDKAWSCESGVTVKMGVAATYLVE